MTANDVETTVSRGRTEAPSAASFPTYPVAWYLFGETREFRRQPLSKDLLGRRLVAFRTDNGRPAVLDARCGHMRADLGKGCVTGETIQCPYHQWQYDVGGRCVHIPAAADVPDFARQVSYPVAERHGLLFFFNGPEPLFPLPFFGDAAPDDFVRARPFGMVLNCPWWLVGANAFDVQHFRGAHDRQLAGAPQVDCPTPYARRATAPFAVVGHSPRDRLTRWFGGNEVEMSVTDWCGNLLFVTATFRRTRSYGVLTSLPLGRERVLVRGIVFVPRSKSRIGRSLIDPIHLIVRRHFIKEFLRFDAELATRGISYNPQRLLECDGELVRYFEWLAATSAHARASVGQGVWTRD